MKQKWLLNPMVVMGALLIALLAMTPHANSSPLADVAEAAGDVADVMLRGNNFNNVRVDPEGAIVGEEDPTMVAHPTQADTLYVAWEGEGDDNIYFSRSTDGGQTWEAARLLADETGSSYHPTLAI